MSLQVPGGVFKKPDLPLPNRGPQSNPSAGAVPHVPARPGKVQLAPGHSPLDWARLTHSLPGKSGGLQRITPSQLKEHRRRGDLWMALGGRVYNCTRYLDYHPGGPAQLMRGAGRDATALFTEIHAWVNFESMMEKCMVGILVPEPENDEQSASTC